MTHSISPLLEQRARARTVQKRRVERVAEWALALGIACLPFSRHVYVVSYVVDEYLRRYGGGPRLSFILAQIAFVAALVSAVYALRHNCGWTTLLKGGAAMAICSLQIWWLLKLANLPAV